MDRCSTEMIFLIHQFLNEGNYKETAIKLEKESGFYFNMKYFEGLVLNGEWDEAEGYLSGFTKLDDNQFSFKIFFDLRKQKYLEALDRHDSAKAFEILNKDLKVFSSSNEDLFKQLALLLTLPNIRENELLSKYVDAQSGRSDLVILLRKTIEQHPLLHDKLQFPVIAKSRLTTLIKHSVKWQHHLCKNPMPKPQMKSLFVDHNCEQPSTAPPTVPSPTMGLIPRMSAFPVNIGSPPLRHPTAGQSPMPRQAFSAGPLGLNPPKFDGGLTGISLRRPRPPSNNPVMDHQAVDFESVMKRLRQFVPEQLQVNIRPPVAGHGQPNQFSADLPMTVAVNLTQGSTVKSMDFHPMKQTLLLVGTVTGEFSLWEVCSGERITSRNFQVWDIGVCSKTLQGSLANEYAASVNKVMWSLDGRLFGVAYSKHIIHLYTYHDAQEVKNHLEIDAHVGGVNDLAFANPENKLSVVTCGDDKTVKVWDVASGARMFTFEGHNSPVYSICSHYNKEHVQFILSTSVDGQVRLWLFDNNGPIAKYGTPGQRCISLVYSADGKRLFSCGTNNLGESYLAEWNEINGQSKKDYAGLADRSVGIVRFDTARWFLAAGDEFKIKFWDMNFIRVLCTCDADGGLPASPCIRFNKDGALLAVSTNANGIKILGNREALQMIRAGGNRTGPPISTASVVRSIGDARATRTGIGAADKLTLTGGEGAEKPKIWKMTEITKPSQIRSLRLPDSLVIPKIMRLTYTNSGEGILALAYNGLHRIWKWQKNDMNAAAKATSSIPPQLWHPASGMMLINETSEANLDEAVPCFALSSNDSFLLSASGGTISLFHMATFKTIATFVPTPPTATSVAFITKDINIVAIGTDDTSIYIHDVRLKKVNTKLKGHEKRVTGLAFSSVLNVLVSSGADAQLCVWSIDKWEKKASDFLQTPPNRSRESNTRVQFHQDQTQFLVVHESLLAVYEALKLECIKQWVRDELCAPITDSAFSCDNRSIYASFGDGSVRVFTSGLEMKCRIDPMSYLSASQSSTAVYPLAISAHPSEPNQFALGLTDGSGHVLEPLEAEGKWGTAPLGEDVQSQT